MTSISPEKEEAKVPVGGWEHGRLVLGLLPNGQVVRAYL